MAPTIHVTSRHIGGTPHVDMHARSGTPCDAVDAPGSVDRYSFAEVRQQRGRIDRARVTPAGARNPPGRSRHCALSPFADLQERCSAGSFDRGDQFIHGVGLDGEADVVDDTYLARVRRVARRLRPGPKASEEMNPKQYEPDPIDDDEAALDESGVGGVLLPRQSRCGRQAESGTGGDHRVQAPTTFESAATVRHAPKRATKATGPPITLWTWCFQVSLWGVSVGEPGG